MKKIKQRISPAGFAMLKENLLLAELNGYGPDVCARKALNSVALYQKKLPVEVEFIVDYSLDGPIWPFMDWPEGWDRHDKSTWR